MGKFKDSPLTRFITPTAPAEQPAPRPTIAETQPPPQMHRKPRKIAPAETEERARRAAANARYYSDPVTPPDFRAAEDHADPRSRRVQLLMKPGLHSELKAIAHATGQSLNHLIETVLLQYAAGQRDTADHE
ncbi:MAG: hypothetical protein PHD67_09295 [Oscillospiraceae bacterium]|nr:hypothetical protein [Oscillospiraceae bacterium]